MALKQKANSITGAKEQFICKPCNRLNSRVYRMMKKHDNLKGFSELSQAERKVFFQESDGLFDDALAKAMHTAIQSSSYKKQSTVFDEHGDFFDEEEVNEKFKDRPSQLASLLAKGRRMRCPVRGVELIWVPTYSLSIKKEHGDAEERKQVVQQDTTVKRKKIEKENAGTKGNRNTRPRVDGDNPPADVPLGNAQVQRLEKAIPLLEDARLRAVTACVNASAPEMQDYVPRRYLEKSKVASNKFEAYVAEANKLMADKKGAKGEATSFFSRLKEETATIKEITQTLNGYVQEKEDEASCKTEEEDEDGDGQGRVS